MPFYSCSSSRVLDSIQGKVFIYDLVRLNRKREEGEK